MALVGVELETLVSESDALATRPPPCAHSELISVVFSTLTLPSHLAGVKLS